jgi:RecB family endonuclease NucS
VDGGAERHVEAGFIDILAEDDRGSLVVIELKSDDAPDTSVTQVLSYIGSLRGAENAVAVRGVLVARGFSTRVRLAAQAAGIELVTYGYSFTFTTYDPAV